MNNKGFAITTILYGTMLLFSMLLVSMLGILASYRANLEKLINNNNGARDIIMDNITINPSTAKLNNWLTALNSNYGTYVQNAYYKKNNTIHQVLTQSNSTIQSDNERITGIYENSPIVVSPSADGSQNQNIYYKKKDNNNKINLCLSRLYTNTTITDEIEIASDIDENSQIAVLNSNYATSVQNVYYKKGNTIHQVLMQYNITKQSDKAIITGIDDDSPIIVYSSADGSQSQSIFYKKDNNLYQAKLFYNSSINSDILIEENIDSDSSISVHNFTYTDSLSYGVQAVYYKQNKKLYQELITSNTYLNNTKLLIDSDIDSNTPIVALESNHLSYNGNVYVYYKKNNDLYRALITSNKNFHSTKVIVSAIDEDSPIAVSRSATGYYNQNIYYKQNKNLYQLNLSYNDSDKPITKQIASEVN